MDLNSKMAGMAETAYQNKANIGHNMGLREDTCAYRPRLTERVQKQAHQFAENAEHAEVQSVLDRRQKEAVY